MADLRRAIQTRPDQWKAYLSLAKAYADHKRAQEAEEQFRNALRVAEEQFQKGELDAYTICVLYRNRGAIHQELIRAREHQLGTQGKDVKKDPELQQYYQAAFDDYKAAIHAIERDTGGKVPTDSFEKEGLARAHFDRGRLYQRRAEYQKAVDEFNAVLNADPPSSLIHRLAVYRWRGDAQYQQDKYAAAVASYDQYLKTGSLSNAVGGLLAFGSDTILPPLTPIMVRRQFLQGGRTLADAFRARGFCHTKLDNFAAAIEDYSAAAELDPDAWNTYSLRGRAYLALAVYPLAGLDFDRAILLHPRDSDLYTGRGSARVKMGRMIPEGLQDAEDALKWAAQADQAARDAQQPNRMTASQWATLYYQAARIYAQAVDQLDKAVQRGEPPDSARRARYRDRGLALLLRAVDANEPRQRARFWQVTIQPDRDLEPLRGPEFVRLQEQYGRSVADLAREVDEAVRLAPHDQRVLLEGARTYANLAYTLFWQAYRGDA